MGEILDIYSLIKELVDKQSNRRNVEFEEHIQNIFIKTEIILKNYMEMFAEIRINIISGKFDLDDVINYLLKREYELKDVRIYVREFLKDKYYQSDNTLVKFVAAIYGIMECYPVQDQVIVDKSRHTINSYISYCHSLSVEPPNIQKQKILTMTNGILKDITTSWETVCACYNQLK